MNFEEVKTVLEDEFLLYWNSRTPVETENIKYKPTTGTPWVRLEAFELNTKRPELGDNHIRKRHFGVVMIEVFVPAYTGRTHSGLFTDAEQSLQYKNIPEITLGSASVLSDGDISGGAWSQKTISTPFDFDEILN